LSSVVSNSSAVYNILYRTADSHGKPSFAVTTVFVPLLSTDSNYKITDDAAPLLSYLIDYDTPNLDDSPSFALPLLYTSKIPDIVAALSRGWYVTVPDYEGPTASFTAGLQAGRATLDSLRATLHAGLGLHRNTRTAVWGYSGGSIAGEWATELQAQYAPELTLSGAALGGLIPDIQSVVITTSGTALAGLVPLGCLGLSRQYPGLLEYFEQRLKSTGPFNKTGFLAATNMSADQAFGTYTDQNMFNYFTDGIDVLQGGLLQEAFHRDGIMGNNGIPRMPLFVYKAIQDEVSPIRETDALVNKYCSKGGNILYHRNTVGEHFSEQFTEDATALKFLASVLEDRHSVIPKGCTIQNVTVEVTSP
jgi:hypothetical protein